MKIKLLVISLALFAGTTTMRAQEKNNAFSERENKHSIRISMSDGLTLGVANVFGMGLSDALSGTKRSDHKSSGVLGLGYRYSLKRFRVGADVGFASISSKTTFSGEKVPSIKEKELNFLVLPTAEYVYFKRGLVELYGSVALGVDFIRHSESGLNDAGKQRASASSKFDTQFAYQVNPIGIRVGNQRIGGFVETGLGYRGFVTAGISLGF